MLKIGQSVFSGTSISALRRRRLEPNRSVHRAKKMTAPVRPAVSPEVRRRPRTVRSRRVPADPCQEIHFGRFSAHPAMRARFARPARGADGHRAGRVPGRGGARGTPPSRLRGLDPLPLTAGRCTFFGLLYFGGSSAGVRCIFSGLLHALGGGPVRPIPLRRRPGEGLRTGSTGGGCAFPQFGGSLSSRGFRPRPVRGRRERAREARIPCHGRAKLAKRCIGVATGCRGRTKVPKKSTVTWAAQRLRSRGRPLVGCPSNSRPAARNLHQSPPVREWLQLVRQRQVRRGPDPPVRRFVEVS